MQANNNVKTLDQDAIMQLIRERRGSFEVKSAFVDGDAGFLPKDPIIVASHAEDFVDLPPPPVPEAGDAPPLEEVGSSADFSPSPPPEAIDLDALRAEAFAEGQNAMKDEITAARSDGIRLGREEAQAELAEARQIFLDATTALSRIDKDIISNLTASLRDALIRLSSERSGQAIDDVPHAYLEKLERLAQRAAASANEIVLRLNEKDLDAISSHLDGTSIMSKSRMIADKALARGDFILEAGEVGISDILGEAVE